MSKRPLIGCATYRKRVAQEPPIDVYGLMPSYTEAVLQSGGLPVLIPLGLDEESLMSLLARLDGLLLPGGGDIGPAYYGGDEVDPTVRDVDPERDRSEILLVRRALEQQKPLLAICRGHQVFNVALGGTLWEDVHTAMPNAIVHDYFSKQDRAYLAHEVDILPDSLLARIVQSSHLPVNSLHHQGIRELAPGLRAVAAAPDGLIEAVEVPDHPFALGVQWHPENLIHVEPAMRALFSSFVAFAGNGTSAGDERRQALE
jgi:putative glutamine amidotransferase